MKKIILAFGSTGLGKTTMAHLLCEANVKGSSGIESATKIAVYYETDKYLYIDTCGFGDSSGKTDEELFHDMMCLFQRYGQNNIFNINTILWFCSESERETSHLQREANFIQRLVEYTDECNPIDLWKSVLIITKGNLNLRKLVDGPKSAARNACWAFSNKQHYEFNEDSFFVKHFPCWIYDTEGITEENARWVKMDSKTRFEFNCYRQDEIKSKVQHLISNFSPITIRFKQGICKKCNVIGDPRLFITQCHTKSFFKHSIKIEYFHPEEIVHFHSGSKFLVHEPDENSIKKLFESIFDGDQIEIPVSQVSSEIAEKIIESCKLFNNQTNAAPELQPELQPSFMSQIISHAPQAASNLLQTVAPLVTTLAVPRMAPSTVTSTYLLSGPSVAFLVICSERNKCCYEAKNISCCIEKCDNCKKEWIETGCATGYGCCKQEEGKLGCQAHERCTICDEAAIELNSQGCTEFCVKCKEMWNITPGCDSASKHDVLIMD
uniref:G domain-containing protein n=1 Tax=Rhizophagus irregularis (strain DAOM 181602 / DAOM 197198 / MUCL 43194) TaxID=747089 RepID=U9SRD4_RHIID